MFSEKIRKIGFDIVDTLTRGGVLRNKKEIDYLFHNPDKVKSFQNEKFQALAKWAVENTTFYSQVKKTSEYDLSDFPIINKNMLKEHAIALKEAILTESINASRKVESRNFVQQYASRKSCVAKYIDLFENVTKRLDV